MKMKEEIEKCLAVLQDGGLIVYPTNTGWAIGCDATNEEAVSKVYGLKEAENSDSLHCLVANQAMLERHVTQVPDLAYDLMDLSAKPLTIIYDNPKGIANNLVASGNTLAIQVASDQFCQRLINRFRRPIVAASANQAGAPEPVSFKEISTPILAGVDYVVALYPEANYEQSSSIIKLSEDGTVKVIRE